MVTHKSKNNPATQAWESGAAALWAHPVFAPLNYSIGRNRTASSTCPQHGWLKVHQNGNLQIHPKRNESANHWTFVLGRGVLYLAMELFQPDRANWPAWSAACDVVTTRFMTAIRLGQAPEEMHLPDGLPNWDEDRWYQEFCSQGVPAWVGALSLGGADSPTMQAPAQWNVLPGHPVHSPKWAKLFAEGIADSVEQAVEVAAGSRQALAAGKRPMRSATARARSWFMGSFPLLGAMVSAFDILEDTELCRREDIAVAAVNETQRTIYLNPTAGLSEQEIRFVLAHEVLHVALRHQSRQQGRDHFLWNVACDYVINEWLLEMQVGMPPPVGMLHDSQLKGLSAEEVYDRIVVDMRRIRKLRTFAGAQCDMLEKPLASRHGAFTDLDAFYKEQLSKGLLLHQAQGRGYLPAGLLEEIRALLQPPIPWEVQLARWFDHHFPPIETRRSYARLSRRQSATPDIPRPRVGPDPRWLEGRTFGVVLDTSGSMDRNLLAKALGAIASYAQAKEVPAVRVVFCDATTYDAGYLLPEDIAGRVEVRGRGGTVLQPAIDLLQSSTDFPEKGPLLVITDGMCDTLTIRREHAFLLPGGRRLPFSPKGEVFYFE